MKNLNKTKIYTNKITNKVTITELLWNEFLLTGKIGWYLLFSATRDLEKNNTTTKLKDTQIYGRNC